MKTNVNIVSNTFRKLGISLLLAAVGFAAFATLGDGKSKKEKPSSLLSLKGASKPGAFSLRSNYSFRGNQVINAKESKYINLNTVVTYQQGNTTFILPMKKKVAMNGKLTFNPNAATR